MEQLTCGKCPGRPYLTRTECWGAKLKAGVLWKDNAPCPRSLDDMRAEWWSLKSALAALEQAIAMREAEERAQMR